MNKRIIELLVVIVTISALLFLYFIYPNFSAWESVNLNNQIKNIPQSSNTYYKRYAVVILNKNLYVEGISIWNFDINSDNLKVQVIPIPDNVIESGIYSKLFIDYKTSYKSFFLDNFDLKLDNVIFLNSDNYINLKNYLGFTRSKPGIDSKNYNLELQDYYESLISSMRYDVFWFFKQRELANLSSNFTTNLKSSELKTFFQDIRNSSRIEVTVNPSYSKNLEPYTFFTNEKLLTEKVRVEIRNASTESGLANKFSKILMNEGIYVIRYTNFNDEQINKNVIMLDPKLKDSETVKLIKSMFKTEPEVILQKPSSYTAGDILVIIAQNDFR